MKVCNSCQTEINEKAKKCPNCREDQRNFFAKHKILTTLLALIILIIIVSVASGGGDKSNNAGQNDQSGQTSTQDQPKVAEKITATQLADDFDANQVAAEEKYKDKYVEFSAAISNITDNGLSFQDVGSKEFSFTQISCDISNKQDLVSVKNGQQVTVRGTVGGQTIGVISVKDCSLVQ